MLNKVHCGDCLELFKKIDDNSIDLIICDPPYYKAINHSWDKQWKTEPAYLEWCDRWFDECVRVLKSTGSFYCYGNFDILTKQKIHIFDKKLQFRQNITLHKGLKSIAGRTSDALRMFPTATEYLLFYVKQDETGLTTIKTDLNNFSSLRSYFQRLQFHIGLNKKQIIDIIGQGADHPFRWDSSQWDMPTDETYRKIIDNFNLQNFDEFLPYESLRQEYESLRQEYESLRFVFNVPIGVTDVWDFNLDKVRYGHPTQKPQEICKRIIQASSRIGDLILVPFVGSGSEVVAAKQLGRKYIGFEIDESYIEIANNRLRDDNLSDEVYF